MLVGYKHTEQADFSHFSGQIFREGLFFIQFQSDGGNFFLGKLAYLPANHFLLIC